MSNPPPPSPDCPALVAISDAFQLKPPIENPGCCQHPLVTCTPPGTPPRRATGINIAGFNASVFPKEISQLTSLESIVISGSQLKGSIPSDIGGLQNLITLDLSNNQLTGELPSNFANLGRLSLLNLANNQLTGKLDVISRMDRLLDLNLGGNKFDGLQTAWNFKPTKCVVGGSFCVNVTVPAVCGLSVCAAPTQTATPTPQSSVESSSPGLSVGAIVGIVAGAAFVLAIAIFAVFMIRRRTPKQDKRTTIVTLGQEDEMAVFRGNVSDYESMSRPAFSEYASSTKLAENAPHYSQFQTDPESETDLSNLSTMRADTLPKSGKFATLDEFYEALRHAGLSEDVLGHISQVFSQQSILPVHLKKLNDRKLKDLGIVQLGVRETILFVIFS